MIKNASISNYKSLHDVRFGLERFTVFVGPNASGKSSILQALDLLCRTFRMDHPAQMESEILKGISRGGVGNVDLAVEIGDRAYRYRTVGKNNTRVTHHPGQKPWLGTGRGVSEGMNLDDWKEWKTPTSETIPTPQAVLLRLETSNLLPSIAPASGSDLTVMAPNGIGIHSSLASMTLNDPDSWQALQENLRQIIPSIRRLRHTKAAHVQQPTAVLFDTQGGDSLPADQVSEGTLLVLGLLTALYSPDRPNLMLLDDLDRGLHPKAQKALISLLRGLLASNANLQIVATTHSPYLLDCMNVNEVRMTILDDQGATMCAPLTDHPKYSNWKDEMAPGEMWSLFGEKWITEGVAV